MSRSIQFTIGVILAFPLLVLLVMAFTLPITTSGVGYLLGAFLVVVGLIAAPRLPKYFIVVAAGVLVMMFVAGMRLLFTSANPNSSLKVVALPDGNGILWVNALIDEQDGLIFGEALFHRIGGASNNEHKDLTPALLTAYTEMRKEGNFSSPIVSTYLGLQRPRHFDAVILAPDGQPQFGVVFLHGYMGNVTAQCWEIAQAVKKLGGVTVCPSTIWTGEWWQPNGQAILHATFDYVRAQGIESIYLGGFSNGGFGISRLSAQWKDEKGLAGLIFIDGFANGTEIREAGLPVLIIQGAQDERVPVEAARQFASEVGDLGTYAEIEGDHFLIMKHPDLVQNEIEKWLRQQETGK